MDDRALDSEAELVRVLRDDGSTDPACDPFLPDALVVSLFAEMTKLRLLDETMTLLQRQGRVGFYGACRGQEAVVIASAFATEPADWVFPALRESPILLVRGFPLVRYLAQVFGNADDVLKGRQMPSHMSARAHNVVSWSSCIATQLPHAVGAAWAARYRRAEHVVVGFVGDGGTSESDFHAALNFAGVLRVPAVFICQNNQWAISTPAHRQTASETFAVKGQAYGISGVRVDGNDALAVYRAVADARRRALLGHGPTFIECVTYRMGAHSTSDDPTRYQPASELEQWAAKDPLERLRRHLSFLGLSDPAYENELVARLKREIDEAIVQAERAPKVDPRTLLEDVYAAPPWHLREQMKELSVPAGEVVAKGRS